MKAKAHAKQVRKARRGERRGRAEVKATKPGKPRKAPIKKAPAKKTPTKTPPKPKKP